MKELIVIKKSKELVSMVITDNSKSKSMRKYYALALARAVVDEIGKMTHGLVLKLKSGADNGKH